MRRMYRVGTAVFAAALAFGLAPLSIAHADPTAPVVSAVGTAPEPVNYPTTTVTLAAMTDDSIPLGTIAGADYQLDGGAWVAMAATDGSFDGVIEGVTASVGPLSVGSHTLCVRATDSFGTTSAGTDCTTSHVNGQPAFSINSPSVNEGNSGTTALVFTVTPSAANAGGMSVDFADAGTGTGVIGTDYQALAPGTLNWPANDATPQTITVNVIGNTVYQVNRTVKIKLSNAVGGILGPTPGTGTILDDDSAPVAYVVGAQKVETKGKKPITMLLTVHLSLPTGTGKYAIVKFASSNGTAVAGTDYLPVSATQVEFAPGQLVQTVKVPILRSLCAGQPDRYMVLTLTSASNATLSPTLSSAAGVIVNGMTNPCL
jgi:Calx-beta domain